MADTEISVAVVRVLAELQDFRKEMKTLGPSAEAAAADMTRAIKAGLKQAEDAHRATAKVAADAQKQAAASAASASGQTGRSWNEIAKSMQSNQMISDMEQIGSMFSLVGGSVSKASMVFTSSVRPLAMLGELMGPAAPLALGLAALPVSLMLLKGTLTGVVDGALAAEAAMRKIGVVTDKNASAELRQYEWATKDLEVAWAELSITVGEELAPALATFASASASTIRTISGIWQETEGLRTSFQSFVRVLLAVGSGGLTEVGVAAVQTAAANNDLGDSYIEIEKNVQKLHDTYINKIKQDLEYQRITEMMIEEGNLLQDELDAYLVKKSEEEAAEKAAAKAKQEVAAADAELMAQIAVSLQQDRAELQMIDQKNQAILDLAEAKEAALDAEAEAYRSWWREKAMMEQDDVDKAEERANAVRQVWLSTAASILNAFDQMAGNLGAFAQKTISANETANDSDRARIRTLKEKYTDTATLLETMTKEEILAGNRKANAEIRNIRSEMRARDQQTQKAQNQAVLAHGLSQTFATGQIAISGAMMIMNMAAQLANFMPAPANMVTAAGLGGALIATQLAAIATTPPPQFPMGGMVDPDHRLVGVRGDEGILTPRGLRNVGGDQGLADLNAGVGRLGGSSDRMVRVLEEIRDALRPPRGGGVRTAMRGRGRR